MYLVLDVFTISLFARNHFAQLASSVLTVSIRVDRFFPKARPWVSSAKRNVRSADALGRSFMKHRKSMGPKMVPCSTEISIVSGSESTPSMSTL